MRFRLLIAFAAFALVALDTAPARADWLGLPSLNDASGPSWVREYATGLPPTTIYAATEGDGVWKSVNDGLTWSSFSSGLPSDALNVRTVYTSGTTVYAGTSAGLFSNAGGGWQPTKLVAPVQAVLSPLAGQMLAGVASGGVYRSSDGGSTWTPPAAGNGMAKSETVWSFAQLIPGSVFAATSSGIYRSLDGGSSWTLSSDGIAGTTLRVMADGHNPNIFYAITPGNGVYRSINLGETWSEINGSGAHSLGNLTARAMTQFFGVNQTRLYVGTANGVYAGTTGNGPVPGAVSWRHVTNNGLGNNTIFWALTSFLTTPGTLLGGTQSNGGYALTFTPAVNQTAPAIAAAGAVKVGQELHVTSNGTWTGTGEIEFEYQWQRCASAGVGCQDIPDATQPSYDLEPADLGKTLRVTVAGKNDFPTFGLVPPTPSNSLGAVGAKAGTLPGEGQSSTASISGPGLPQSGDTLHAQGWLFTPGATTSTTFQWLRCDGNGNACHPIAGATGVNYVATDADVTLRLRVEVTGTNPSGSTTLDPSGPTNTIFPQAATQKSPATMTGKAEVGESLIGGVGAWKYPGTTFVRQWERCEADGSSCATLSGAKSATYKLTAGDVGHRLRVRITADSNEDNHFPDAVEVFTPLSDVVAAAPVIVDQPAGGGGAPPAPGGGGGAPAADTTPPAFASLKLAKAKVKHGGTLSLRSALSEAGTLSVKLERLRPGRRSGKRCKAGTHKGAKCTAVSPAGAATLGAGAATLNVKKLAAGSYRAVVTPVDAAGNRGAARTLSFTITR